MSIQERYCSYKKGMLQAEISHAGMKNMFSNEAENEEHEVDVYHRW